MTLHRTMALATAALTLALAACSGGGGGKKAKPTDLQFDSVTYVVSESGGTVTIIVNRSGDVKKAISVDYATQDGTAMAGFDYAATSGTLSWAANDGVSKTFQVTITDEFDVEPDETFDIVLSNPQGQGARLGTTISTLVTITNDDLPGTLQLDAAFVFVDETAATATVTATRTGGVGGAVSVDYDVTSQSATAGADFIATSGTLSWAAGDAAPKTFNVTIIDDALVEGDEQATIALSTPVGGATLGAPSTAALLILDDEVELRLKSATYATAENGGLVTIDVERVGGSSQAVTVDYATADITATAGVDYTAASGTLSWAASDTTDKSLIVAVLDDFLVEPDEDLAVNLSNPTGGAAVGNPQSATVTITNDDQPGVLQLGAALFTVGEAPTTVTIDVTRTGGVGNAVQVDYATASGVAMDAFDFTGTSGTLFWAAGEGGAKSFPVDILDDGLVEGEERFDLLLSNVQGGAAIGPQATAEVEILDDEVEIVLDSAAYSGAEAGGSVTITARRLGGASQAIDVDFATADAGATAGVDYTATSGTLSWGAGDSTDKTFPVDIIDDGDVEGDEDVAISLSNPQGGAALGTPNTATLTITDDDTTLQFDMAAYSVSEATATATITVTRLGGIPGTFSVDYATSDGTAAAGSDYTATSGTFNWTGGDVTSRSFDVSITNDILGEAAGVETVNLTLSNPTGGATVGTPGTATLDILDDDVSLEFTLANYDVIESVGNATITVARRGILSGGVGVDYDASGGNASDGVDYTSTSGTLAWADLDGADKTFDVTILNDLEAESPETIDLTLSNFTGGATPGLIPNATITINDDEQNVQFTMLNFDVNEDAGTVTVSIARVGDISGPASVDYATSDGTALDGLDYTATSGTAFWLAGDPVTRTFDVPILDDGLREADETFDVTLSNPVGAMLGNPTTSTVTILDDEVGISGTISYDRVPLDPGSGLDYGNITSMPCRGVVVELVRDSDMAVLDSTVTDATGAYSLSSPRSTLVYVRVLAQLLATGGPDWDMRIVDNTNGQALYAAVTSTFDSGTVDLPGTDIAMDSGWGGSSYTGPREAGPFAIVDSVYTAIQKVLTADPTASFPLLNINWSVNNVNDSGGDRSAGLIGGSFYDPNEVGIYLLGEEDDDTEEYDPAVIIHEWGHYFDDQFVRNESPGGPHFLGDALDMRVAWGEGFATGIFSVLMDITEYVDTGGLMQGSNLVFQDVEDNSEFEADEGWFSETSVQVIVYDLYDSTDDGDDTITMGFGPLYATLNGSTPFSPAMSTVFTFAHHLKADNPGDAAAIDSLLAGESITTTALDEFDSTGTETNDGGEALSLPVYRTLIVGSPAGTHCSTGAQGNYNAIANRLYFRVVIATNGTYDITAVPDPDGDPAIWVWDSGTPIAFEDAGGGGFTEVETVNLSAGTYVVEVYDQNIVKPIGGKSGTECFDVSIQ